MGRRILVFATDTLPPILIGFVAIIGCLHAYHEINLEKETGVPASPFVFLMPFVGFAIPAAVALLDRIVNAILGFVRSKLQD